MTEDAYTASLSRIRSIADHLAGFLAGIDAAERTLAPHHAASVPRAAKRLTPVAGAR